MLREGVGVDAVGGGAREGVELRATLAHALRVGGVHFVVDELARGHVPARVEVGAVTQRQVRVRLDDPTEVDLLARVRRAVDSRAVLLGAVATELLELGAAGRTEAVRLARLLRRRLREKLEKLVRLLLLLLLLDRLCVDEIHHLRQFLILHRRRRAFARTRLALLAVARRHRRRARGATRCAAYAVAARRSRYRRSAAQ
mmetsp:Transcript_53298/g.116230  ORF Transcript_53298/g.116230 Transcript_53298/m.116230 type:complete len:200 (-) Transcript_53298:67-666(-)